MADAISVEAHVKTRVDRLRDESAADGLFRVAAAPPDLPMEPTSALAVLLLELANVTASLRRLSDDLPPRLRARVQKLYLVIEVERARWFPEVE